jgi:hypothetical protein
VTLFETNTDLINFLNRTLPIECKEVICITVINRETSFNRGYVYKVEILCSEILDIPLKFKLHRELEKLMIFFGLVFETTHIKIIYPT